MSQNDFNLANQGFPSMRADLNSAFQALASNSSGTTAPSTTYAYQWWYDEVNNTLKMRNANNDAWIDFASFDQINDTWLPYVGGQVLSELGYVEGVTSNIQTQLDNKSSRNLVINGNFGVNQRGVSGTVTLTAGEYGHDRWKAGSLGCTYTFSTTANVTTITITSGSLVQVVEGLNIKSGTHVLSWTGTVQMKINSGTAGNSGLTATLTGGTNATIETSGTGTVSLVQLELGSSVTPFEMRPTGYELFLCQRYFQTANTYGWGSTSAAGVFRAGVTYYMTQMRTVPTLTAISATGFNVAGAFPEGQTSRNFGVYTNVLSAGAYSINVTWYADAEL